MDIGQDVYWVNDGDVIKGKLVALDEFNAKIETNDGHRFGRLKGDFDHGEIWPEQLAETKDAAIKLVKKGMSLTRATMSAWKDALYDLESGQIDATAEDAEAGA